MSELNKLENYLKTNKYVYERIDSADTVYGMGRHQIFVPSKDNPEWDAICQWGSYGYEQGLLEIMGCLVDPLKDGDTVVGYLTADDVIKRMNKKENKS